MASFFFFAQCKKQLSSSLPDSYLMENRWGLKSPHPKWEMTEKVWEPLVYGIWVFTENFEMMEETKWNSHEPGFKMTTEEQPQNKTVALRFIDFAHMLIITSICFTLSGTMPIGSLVTLYRKATWTIMNLWILHEYQELTVSHGWMDARTIHKLMLQLSYMNHHNFWVINVVHVFFTVAVVYEWSSFTSSCLWPS